jgi:hypothetical protein
MARCARCPPDGLHEAAVEITRWTAEGTETLYRCPRCGWEESSRALEAGSATPVRAEAEGMARERDPAG